jgi:hypothetical protein
MQTYHGGFVTPITAIFGLGSKHSMVIVEVIMISSEPMVMAPQHRCNGQ